MMYRWTIGHVSINYRSSVGQVSVICRSSDGRISVKYRSCIGHVSVEYRRWNTVSVDTIVGRQSTDIAVDIAAAISTEATYSTHDPIFFGC